MDEVEEEDGIEDNINISQDESDDLEEIGHFDKNKILLETHADEKSWY